jgi:hypothetical protein
MIKQPSLDAFSDLDLIDVDSNPRPLAVDLSALVLTVVPYPVDAELNVEQRTELGQDC